ncbi:large ribosomal subunit protein uL24m-like [Littorina saxatilis]|uniref:Large ribosomal subunit protein uL24m n=1 Tax=Littorina saxatilis TaxID=31220 RepID=A0AAN9GQ10_9CAEN
MRLTVVTFNYLKKYAQREIAKATGVSVYKPFQGRWRDVRKKRWYYDENRPWTDAAKAANAPMKRQHHRLLEPISNEDWSIFKGDRVEILTGTDKGKMGIVSCVIKERNWVFVEGLNCKYKWVNKSATSPGAMVKTEKPLSITTEVALVDPSDGKGSEVQWRFTEEGDKVRVSVRTGRIIPMSRVAEDETEDMVSRSGYIEQDCDTKEKELQKVTFKPILSTFDEDILKQLDIKDDRKRVQKYWY